MLVQTSICLTNELEREDKISFKNVSIVRDKDSLRTLWYKKDFVADVI